MSEHSEDGLERAFQREETACAKAECAGARMCGQQCEEDESSEKSREWRKDSGGICPPHELWNCLVDDLILCQLRL